MLRYVVLLFLYIIYTSMKKTTTVILLGFALVFGIFAGCGNTNTGESIEQQVYQKTMDVSRVYIGLRHQTDILLLQASTYEYDERNTEMVKLIQSREQLQTDVAILENDANAMTSEVAFSLFSKVAAYDRNEISNIFDKAPAGKKIATLAKHLGVDAKMAFKILKNDQAQVEADAWNEAGDTFQKLETSATVIKDGCKVAGYVWGIAVGWGVAALAGKWLLTQAAVIVGGADLVLEVTDDWAKIALGNHNKISSVVSDVRTVTEPIANILSITDISNNLENSFEKFSAVMIALESFRWSAQEGKVIGIELPVYKKTEEFTNIKKYKAPIYVSTLSQEEVNIRLLEQQNTSVENEQRKDQEVLEELINNLDNYLSTTKEIKEKQEQTKSKSQVNDMVGVREWTFRWTSSESAAEESDVWMINFLEDGTVEGSPFEDRDYEDDERENDVVPTRIKEWNIVRIYNADFGNNDNYYEFTLQGNTLVFIKFVWLDSEWNRDERLSGSDFFGGKFFEGELQKQ